LRNKIATAKQSKYANGIFLSRISRFNLGWTTGGDGRNVGRVSGISGDEMRETDSEEP
jgi:hypothetical protein